MPVEPLDPIDPFWSPTPERPAVPLMPVRWHFRQDLYWIINGDILRPLTTMPSREAQSLYAALMEQAESDLLAAFRDLPLLTALRLHLDAAIDRS